jgi:parallel beta-helix repeat protein
VSLLLAAGLAASASAATYYVDATHGDDVRSAAQAQSLATPWRTIQKAASMMAAGDTALIRAGTYRETVTPQSGQTFQAYQNEKPLITGCDPVSGWTVHSGSIYKATVTTKVYDVFVGTNYMHKARWPNFNGDYLDASFWAAGDARKVSGIYRVLFDTLTPPNAVGGWYAGVHGVLGFCANEGRITAVSGQQLTLTDTRDEEYFWTSTNHSGAGIGFITDHLNCLDAEKEWHWQSNTLYFRAPGGGVPTNVQARTRLYGFVLTNRSKVTLQGLYFLGTSVQISGGSSNTMDGCHFRQVAPWGNAKAAARHPTSWGSTEDGTAGLYLAGTNHSIRNCSLVGSWGPGIRLDGGNDLTVTNNYVEECNWFGRFIAAPVSGFGTRLTIERNTLKRSGGPGITLYQKNPGDGSNVNHVHYPFIRHNDIRDVTYLSLDGGSFIYIQNADVPSADRWLEGEIAFNVGRGIRSRSLNEYFWGIYIDNGTDFVTLHHNVIHSLNPNRGGAGLFLHGAQHRLENVFSYHNTIWGDFENAIAVHTWGTGSNTNVVLRNNHASGTGFRATALGGVTSDHNRENVPAGEFVDVASSSFRLNANPSASKNAGMVISGINDAGSASPYAGSAPDLGVYEYGGVDWTAGATVTPPVAED